MLKNVRAGEGYCGSAKPYTRWWWFCVELKEDDIKFQLDWLKANNFGGVEIAWVYPLPGQKQGTVWLGSEWSRKVAFAKKYADSIGLGCDFTFGSLWPFGGSFLSANDVSMTFDGPSKQRLRISWEYPVEVPVLNHLDRNALVRYSKKMGNALMPSLKGVKPAMFCDSLEIETDKIWTKGFDEAFERKYGYSLVKYMRIIDDYPDVRYDYRKLVAEYLLNEFYAPYAGICHKLKSFARVQCHGSLTDLLASYSTADVPESEAILFDAGFSSIPASAAALSGRKIVSAESFTCLYGWVPWPGPGKYQKQEKITDIKLVADALFANGINMIIWHGMPYNPEGGENRFYASVHVGPDSAFADDLPAFNKYLEKISEFMRFGRTYSDVAAYLPLEDAWMADKLPEKLYKPSALYHWEMQYVKFPPELNGYHPLWVSSYFLRNAEFKNGLLYCGNAVFTSLYVDVQWLDNDGLKDILRLAKQGLPVCLKRRPVQPGSVKDAGYGTDIDELMSLKNVSTDFLRTTVRPPLVQGRNLPDFWCRTDGRTYYLFFANPLAQGLTYPLRYGVSESGKTVKKHITLALGRRRRGIKLTFKPGQSVLLKTTRALESVFIDIGFNPAGGNNTKPLRRVKGR